MPSEPGRSLAIALNADSELHRGSVCSLMRDLDLWAPGRRPLPPPGAGEPAHPPRLRPRTLERALEVARQAAAIARRELERAAELGLEIITLFDAGYPRALRDLALPPPVLYCKGALPRRPAVAIVGSRQADPYGLEVATLFGRELAAAGLTVVSGFARGIDAAAHRGALEAAGGRTVAVLGCGPDVCYPRRHRRLAREVAAGGALISEFPPGTWPHARNFPIRNRIIAALAVGTLVVQATPRSGSLITARHALDLGRDVYAVPGRIFDRKAAGPNTLIRDGALAAQHPRDILESLPETVRRRLAPGAGASVGARAADPGVPLRGAPGKLLRELTPGEPLTAEQLAARLGLPVEEVLGLLLELELAGWLRRYPGPTYGRRV